MNDIAERVGLSLGNCSECYVNCLSCISGKISCNTVSACSIRGAKCTLVSTSLVGIGRICKYVASAKSAFCNLDVCSTSVTEVVATVELCSIPCLTAVSRPNDSVKSTFNYCPTGNNKLGVANCCVVVCDYFGALVGVTAKTATSLRPLTPSRQVA